MFATALCDLGADHVVYGDDPLFLDGVERFPGFSRFRPKCRVKRCSGVQGFTFGVRLGEGEAQFVE